MEEVGEMKAATHVASRHLVGIDHAGQLVARRCLRQDAVNDQSEQSIMHGGGGVAMSPAGSEDVGGDRIRRRAELKNPSTSVHAQNEQVYTAMAADGRRVGDARAASGP